MREAPSKQINLLKTSLKKCISLPSTNGPEGNLLIPILLTSAWSAKLKMALPKIELEKWQKIMFYLQRTRFFNVNIDFELDFNFIENR